MENKKETEVLKGILMEYLKKTLDEMFKILESAKRILSDESCRKIDRIIREDLHCIVDTDVGESPGAEGESGPEAEPGAKSEDANSPMAYRAKRSDVGFKKEIISRISCEPGKGLSPEELANGILEYCEVVCYTVGQMDKLVNSIQRAIDANENNAIFRMAEETENKPGGSKECH